MNIPKNIINNEVIAAEAASWVAQMDGGPLSSSDKLALTEWVSRSHLHEQEIRRLVALWGGVDQMLDDLLLPKSAPILAVLGAWFRLRPVQMTSVIGSLCLATIFSIFFFQADIQTEATTVSMTTYQVDRGSRKSVPLSDGSVIHLNTDSVVEVKISGQERRVRLLRGEAVFDVAKDPLRPFQVYAGSGRVEALGTSFLVKALDRRIELIVTEGRVRLDRLSYEDVSSELNLDIEPYEQVFVDQGQKVVLDKDIKSAVMLDKSAIAKQTAWLDGKHIFQNDSLNYIAQEMSRHSRRTIIVSDPDLGEMRMGGVFKLGEIDKFISALKVSLDVEVDHVAEDFIYIRRRSG